MSAFEFFSVALSFVLGLGVTRLLLGFVNVFRFRETHRPHWIPLLWAVSVFVYQVQFWWAVFELNTALTQWTHAAFITLMSHTLLLFVAGALVLPASEQRDHDSLLDYFEEDGRWAILALGAYSGLSFWTNWSLFGMSPLSSVGALVAAFLALAIAGFFVTSRRLQGIVAIAYFVMAVFAYVAMAPAQY